MQPKTVIILYWVFTILFAGLMIFSSVGGIGPTAETKQMLNIGMGYPVFFIKFISIAKIIGSITILIPGLNKTVKEWAYAGLFFDLTGAIFSIISISPSFDPKMLGMLLFIIPGILSYYFWKKRTV
jgi:DoxX-like family